MREIPVTEARSQLSELVSQVAYGGEPVVLTRHGKALVALVPASRVGDPQAVAEGSGPRDVPVVLDVTALDRQSQYTIAAEYSSRDEPHG